MSPEQPESACVPRGVLCGIHDLAVGETASKDDLREALNE